MKDGDAMTHDNGAVTALAFALFVLVAVLVAVAAGYLARRDSASYPAALSRSAKAFAATLTLMAVVTGALVALRGQ